jgi:hypothetical protein
MEDRELRDTLCRIEAKLENVLRYQSVDYMPRMTEILSLLGAIDKNFPSGARGNQWPLDRSCSDEHDAE